MALIYLIDDHRENREYLKQILARLPGDYQTAECDNGETALQEIPKLQPDLILLDVALPGTDGFDVCRRLRRQETTASIPIVFISAVKLSTRDKIRGLELGAQAYLTKPVDEGEIRAQVETLVKLHAMEQALRRERDSLEQRVQERTRLLEASYRDWQQTFDSISDWISIIDLKSRRVLQTNAAVHALFHLDPEAIIGTSCCSVLHGTSVPVPDCPYLEVLKTGHTARKEFCHAGSGRWFEVSLHPIPSTDGQAPRRGVHVVRDITEAVRLKEALKSSERTFRIFFENQPVYCYMVSPEGIILDVNRAARRALGYRKRELVGQPLEKIYAPESRPQMERNLERWKRTGRLNQVPMFILTRSGERREVLLQARAIRDEKGTLIASVSVQVDRTAVTRFEAALAESEARFRALAEYSAGAVFIVSGTAFTYVNPAFTTITGYTLEELEGKAFYDIIAPRFRDQVRERGLARQQGKDLPNRYTFAILRADGTERWVDFSAHATTFRGRPALVGSAFDITAYKQAQADLEQLTAELRQQVQLNDQLFRTTSDGYILADDQGWIVDVNPAYCQMIGYSRAELTQMNINQLEGKLTQEQIDARIEQMVRDQRAHFTTRHRTKTGKMIDLDVSVTVLSSPGGPLVAAFVRDITERLQLEKALRRNIRSLETTLNQLQLLIASSSVLFSATLDDMAQAVMQSLDALFRLDFGALLLLNPERTRLTPLAAVSRPARGQPLQDDRKWLRPKRLTPQRGIIGWVATHGESVRSGDVTRDDRFLAVREGIGSELCVPLKTPDEIKGVLAIGSRKKRAYTRRDQDILEALANQLALAVQNRTTLDQLEELNRYLEQRIEERTEELHRKNLDLLQTQEALVDMVKQLNQSSRKLEASLKRLQAANQELEAFSYSVSHDLRAPLRAITGFARILEEDYRDQLDAEGLRLLEVIQSSADQMGQLIDDLLTLSRLGRKHLEIVRVPCAELVQACIEEVSRDFPDLKVEWKIGRLPTVVGDRNLLKQVWLNLLHNAVKFSSKSDHPKVQVRVREEEVRYVFTVRDWGAGFDPRYADKLFQVFQRLHSSQDFPGTGVGLSIVKQILLRHGGEIWAKSKPNQGAAFTFTLLKDGPPQLDPGYNL